MDTASVELLTRHRVAQQETILSSGGVIKDEGWLFPGALGGICDPDRLTRAWRKAARKAGFPTVRLHDIRHHHASLLMAKGVHAKVIQERLGHSTPSFTLSRYAHVSGGLQQEAADV